MTEVIFKAKLNPKFPTATQPLHRFDKGLKEAPWRDGVEATIYLDDPVWEMLDHPEQLRVVISAGPDERKRFNPLDPLGIFGR